MIPLFNGVRDECQLYSKHHCLADVCGISRGQSPLGVGLFREPGLGARQIGRGPNRATGD